MKNNYFNQFFIAEEDRAYYLFVNGRMDM